MGNDTGGGGGVKEAVKPLPEMLPVYQSLIPKLQHNQNYNKKKYTIQPSFTLVEYYVY